MKVLVVDDDAGLRGSLSLILEEGGYDVLLAESAEEGLQKARSGDVRLILCDVRMRGLSGLEFLERYSREGGTGLVLMMTAYGSIDLAVEAMKKGAYDYLPKPFGANEVLLTLRKAVEREELREEVGRLREEVRAERRFGGIVARSPAMLRALEIARKVAAHRSSVLLTGDTGTGKELLARLIHDESERAGGPFIPVNCGAIPETLLESEFFGYRRGAFTGADRDREGLFEAATGGSLFLDEVGELPSSLQVKLLRVLEEGEVRRLGGTDSTSVDVRVVAATNRDLMAAMNNGRFREDLYYRLAVVTIPLPSLRERAEEVPVLANRFLENQAASSGTKAEGFEPGAMEALVRYRWPGNVRELRNVVERAAMLAEGPQIRVEDLPDRVRDGEEVGSGADSGLMSEGPLDGELSVKRRGAELERKLIAAALERTGGHRGRAAELLELSDRALRYKIRDYGLE